MNANRKKVTFPDSGKEMYLPPVSMNGMALKIMRRHPRPDPPRQQVDYGDGVKRWEYNYAHPEYRATLKHWESFLETEAQKLALQRVYAIQLTDEQQAEVNAWREENPSFCESEDSDGAIWIEEIAVSSEADFQALITALRGVDEEEVERIQATFPGDVSG